MPLGDTLWKPMPLGDTLWKIMPVGKISVCLWTMRILRPRVFMQSVPLRFGICYVVSP